MKKYCFLFLVCLFSQLAVSQIATGLPVEKKEFRIAFQGGYSYRLGAIAKDTPPILMDYVNNLKSGYNLGLDASYFLKPTWGLGFKYSRFGSSAAQENMQLSYDGYNVYGSISDNIAINFVGPSYISKYTLANPNHSFFGGMSLGYMSYTDQALVVNRNVKISGATLGAAFDLGYDLILSKYFTFGAQASLTGGALSKITVVDGFSTSTIELEESERESLSRMDLSAGLRFRI